MLEEFTLSKISFLPCLHFSFLIYQKRLSPGIVVQWVEFQFCKMKRSRDLLPNNECYRDVPLKMVEMLTFTLLFFKPY